MASPERNVQLRYIILDACMAQAARDASVVWTKEALLQEVNRQLREDNPATKPIAMRTLEKDIVDMETLYGLRIERARSAGKVHFAYATGSDGMHRANFSENEVALAYRFFQAMDRFKGAPAWDGWLRSRLALQGQLEQVMAESARHAAERNRLEEQLRTQFHGQQDHLQMWSRVDLAFACPATY